jgi:dihydrodipicolinate synthase/N-acetylneuraminate lyase
MSIDRLHPVAARLQGIVPSLNTPFLDDGSVDMASLARLIDHLADAGAVGVLANAVAAEVASLRDDERREMLGLIIERARRRLVVIAGVSAPTVEHAVALAGEARSAGAPVINWRVPPDLPVDDLLPAVRRIAAAGPDLLVLQDLDFTGPGAPVDTVLALAEAEPKLRSVKVECALPGTKISRLLEAAGGRLHVMGGWPTTSMLDSFARGAHAFMPSHMIATLVRLERLQAAGRHDLARLLFERLLPLFAFVAQHLDVSLRVGKMLRVAEGVFDSEHCRPPVMPLDPRMSLEARRLVRRSRAVADEIAVLADGA